MGTVVATDPDGSTLSYQLETGGSPFQINSATGQLTTTTSLDHETRDRYLVTVRVTDSGRLFDTATITIDVTDENDAPFVVGSGIDNRIRADGATVEMIALNSVFDDVDADDEPLTKFSVISSNPALVVAEIINTDQLRLTYQAYSASQNRTPATITVTARDKDDVPAEDVFLVSVTPQSTLEYQMVFLREPSVIPAEGLTTLPTSINEVSVDESFFIEIWVRDLLVPGLTALPGNQTSTGVEQAAVDLLYTSALVSPTILTVDSSVFGLDEFGDDTQAGMIKNFGGQTDEPDRGIAPKFARLGYIGFNANDRGLLQVDFGFDNAFETKRFAGGVAAMGALDKSQIAVSQGRTLRIVSEGGLLEFEPHRDFASPAQPTHLVAADLDGDGDQDVAVPGRGNNRLLPLFNTPGLGHTVGLTAGGVATNVNFGSRALPGEIHGAFYHDIDQNGAKEAGEPGIGSATVWIDLNDDGLLDANEPSVLTDDNGNYMIAGIPALTPYSVRVSKPDDFLFVAPSDGRRVVELRAGEIRDGVNFGVRSDIAAGNRNITGRFFDDLNKDGRDQGEPGVAGVRIYVDLNNNSQFEITEPSGQTAADGSYTISSIPSGTYTVRAVLPARVGLTAPLGNQFSSRQFDTGLQPQAITFVKINDDEFPDLAVANDESSNITLLLNTDLGGGQREFMPLAALSFGIRGFGPAAVAAGDFDKNGSMDLAIANASSPNLAVTFNLGNNTFEDESAADFYAVGNRPLAIAVGDLNNDDYDDLVVANAGDNNVRVLINDKSGGFPQANWITIPLNPAVNIAANPIAVAIADFNGDQKKDLAVVLQKSNEVVIVDNAMTGGTLSFATPRRIAVGAGPLAVTTGDFDGQNGQDLVIANFYEGSLTLLLNNGNGQFASSILSVGLNPLDVRSSDMDQDGDLDLVVTGEIRDGMAIFRNLGGAHFTPPESFGVADFVDALPFALEVGDIDMDGDPDLAIANNVLHTVTVVNNALVPGAHIVQVGDEDASNINFASTLLNQTPTDIALSPSNINENTSTTSAVEVGMLTTTDADAGDTHTYSLAVGTGDTDNGQFRINVDKLEVKPGVVLDHETRDSYSVRVRTTDSTAATYEEVFTIQVTDVNEPPQVSLADTVTTLAENANTSSRVKVADVVVTDDALGTRVLSLSGADKNLFEIDGGALFLKQGTSLDFETNPVLDVTVAVDDPTLGTSPDDTASLAINLTDANDPPTNITLSSHTIAENSDTTSAVRIGTLTTTDQDAGDSFTYSLVSGTGDTDNGKFQITANLLQLKAGTTLNRDTQSNYSVRVRTKDSGNATLERVFTLEVTRISLSSNTIAENTDTTNPVQLGTLTTTVVNVGVTFTYMLVAGTEATDNDRFRINGDKLAVTAGTLLDYETKASYSVRVRSIGSNGVTHEQAFVIQVADVNELPTAAGFDAGTADEDTSLAINVLAHADDPDTGDVLTVVSAVSQLCTDSQSESCPEITIDGSGTIHYDPSRVIAFQELVKDKQFVDTVVYTVEDKDGLRANASVTVTILGNHDWHNPKKGKDVNDDSVVAPIDALIIVNKLNASGPGVLPPVIGKPSFFYDTNDDNRVSPLDALIIINFLNSPFGAGEASGAASLLHADTTNPDPASRIATPFVSPSGQPAASPAFVPVAASAAPSVTTISNESRRAAEQSIFAAWPDEMLADEGFVTKEIDLERDLFEDLKAILRDLGADIATEWNNLKRNALRGTKA
ncbi:MAG: FG-GAP-like repeat-containing protein [Planctomycetota bacterium]|nr:FG-GAP-like repeat-containing protein [Planctomycetota bacterium]